MQTLAFLGMGGSPGMGELLLIFFVFLLLFGAKKLPEIARNFGKAMEQFRRAADDVKREFMDADRHLRAEARKALEESGLSENEKVEPIEVSCPSYGEDSQSTYDNMPVPYEVPLEGDVAVPAPDAAPEASAATASNKQEGSGAPEPDNAEREAHAS